MELTPEQLKEIADMVVTRFRTERPELERTASGQMVVLPPEFWKLQAEFRAEVREGHVHFEATEKRFTGLQWGIGVSTTVLVALLSVYQFLG